MHRLNSPPASPIKTTRSTNSNYNTGGNWISAIDEETGHTYLYNDVTGESKWPSPPNTPAPQTGRSRKEYDEQDDNNENNNYDRTNEERYDDWIKLYDDNQQSYYYYNDKTGESKWQIDEIEMNDDNDDYLKNMALYDVDETKEDGYDNNLEEGGYDNNLPIEDSITITGRGQFDEMQHEDVTARGEWIPESSTADWKAELDPATNQKYYWNPQTGESQWETPQKMKRILQNVSDMTDINRFENEMQSYKKDSPKKKKEKKQLDIDPSQFTTGDSEAISTFFEPEDVKLKKKFEQLRRGATKLRIGQQDRSTWYEWQGAGDGPIFYSKEDDHGGQWAKPNVFILEDEEHPSNSTVTVVSKSKETLFPSSDNKENLNFSDKMNTLKSRHGDSNISNIKQKISEAYSNLRNRDGTDVSAEYKNLKERTEFAKSRWKQITLIDNEDNDNDWDKKSESDSDADEEERPIEQGILSLDGSMNFDALYSRAIIVKQTWPWTCLVDIKTDTIFYRNETEDRFQVEVPSVFKDVTQEEDDEPVDFYAGREGEGAKDLVKRFKSELQTRRNFAAFDHNVQMVVNTSAAQEKGIQISSDKVHHPFQAAQSSSKSEESKNSVSSSSRKWKRSVTSLSIVNKLKGFSKKEFDEKSAAATPTRSIKLRGNRNSIFRKPDGTKLSSNLKSLQDYYSAPPGADDESFRKIVNSHVQKFQLEKEKKWVQHSLSDDEDNDYDLFKDRLQRMGKTLKIKEPGVDFEDVGIKTRPGSAKNERPGSAKKNKIPGQSSMKPHKVTLIQNAVEIDLKYQEASLKEVAIRMTDILDQENSSEYLTDEIFNRHMLEAAVAQHSQLVMPTSMREAKSYPTLPLYLSCPNALPATNFNKETATIYDVSSLHKWKVMTDPLGRLPTYYFHEKTGTVQSGEPIDFRCRKIRNTLTIADRHDFRLNNNARKLLDHHRTLELLEDDEKGVLFYCPKRDAYSADGRFDIDVYDQSKATKSKNLGKSVRASRETLNVKRGYKHTLCKSLLERGDSRIVEVERNMWLKMPPLRLSAPNSRANSRASSPINPTLAWSPTKTTGKFSTNETEILLSPVINTLRRSNSNATLPSTPNMHNSLTDFETFLGTVVNTGFANSFENQPEAEQELFNIANQVLDDSKSLQFELAMSKEEYKEYQKYMFKLGKKPTDTAILMELALWLLLQGYHRESHAVIQRVRELLSTISLPMDDYFTMFLLESKMAARYQKKFIKVSQALSIVKRAPENPEILSQVAMYLHRIRYIKQAEELFIGALLLNPLYVPALRGYGHLLSEKGNFQCAHRYLCRISNEHIAYDVTRLEIAWLSELCGGNSHQVLQSYQTSISTSKNRKVLSEAIQSLGHYYHVRGDLQKALELYKRSIQQDENNAHTLLLMACIANKDLIQPGKADSSFRRGLFLLNSKYRWIALLAHGEATCCGLKDIHRAEEVLRESASMSFSKSIWTIVALTHFLQYVRGSYQKGRRLLAWAIRRRRNTQTGLKHDDIREAFTDQAYDEEEENFTMSFDDSYTITLSIALAYTYLDSNDNISASKHAEAALKLDPQQPAAHRLLGITAYQNPKTRDNAFKHFRSAIKYGINNPYSLRTFSIVNALDGNYEDAYKYMASAVGYGSNNPLSWRALGFMSYLYHGNRDEAIVYLAKAFEISGGIDVEALRLRGQILMEMGNFSEARKSFQTALRIFPWDPLTLSSLAMSLLALGYDGPSSNTWADYDIKLKSIVNLAELITSEDPELLFQASIFAGLDELVAKRFAKVREMGNNIDKSDEESEAKSTKDIKDVPPEVLYWYGMFYLKKGSVADLAKAKVLFTRAVQRQDCPPHPMSLYMLGWISEIQEDLVVAEKYYCYALQLEPMDPLNFLRLIQLSDDTLTFVKTLKKRTEQLEVKRKKMAKRKRKNKKSSTADILGISYGGEHNVFADEEDNIHVSVSPSLEFMKKRVLLHERVHRLSLLRKQQLKTEKIDGLHTPGKMIYIDPFWLDRLFYSFSQCDDWTFLLRASHEFRDKKKDQ